MRLHRSIRLSSGLVAILVVAACSSSGASSSASPLASSAAPSQSSTASAVGSVAAMSSQVQPAPYGVSALPPLSAAARSSSTSPSPTPPPPPPGYANLILYRVPTAGQTNTWYWLISANGTGNRKLALGAYAHWNAGGTAVEVITYNAACTPTLTMFPTAGGSGTVVPIAFAPGDTGFVWSRDGNELAFYRRTSFVCGSSSNLLHTASDLYTVKTNGASLTKIASGLPKPEATSWLPNGSGVVIVDAATALAANGKGNQGPIERIDTPSGHTVTLLGSATYEGVWVSPSGSLLAYIVYSNSQWRTHVIDIRGNSVLCTASTCYQDQDFGMAMGDGQELGVSDPQDGSVVWGSSDATMAVVRSVIITSKQGVDNGTSVYTYDATKHPISERGEGYGWVTASGEGSVTISPDNQQLGLLDHDYNDIWYMWLTAKDDGELKGTTAADWLSWQPWP